MSKRIRSWEEEDFALDLYDTGRTDARGQTLLGYKFYCDETLIFEGEDFAGSPLHADDSDETVAALLSFLSLQPGDTDADYFKNYTELQLAFVDERAETLGMYARDLEERAGETEVDVDDTDESPGPVVVLEAFALFAYNTDFGTVFEAVYGRTRYEAGEVYWKEKLKTWEKNPLTLYGELGLPQKVRLVGAALDKYRKEATRRVRC